MRLIREVRFTGAAAADELCACLLDARETAEVQGRIDFSAAVTFAGDTDVSATIWMGPARAVAALSSAAMTRSTIPRCAAP